MKSYIAGLVPLPVSNLPRAVSVHNVVFFFLRLASTQHIFALLDRRSQAIHSHRKVLFTFVPSYTMNFDHPRTNFLLGSDDCPG